MGYLTIENLSGIENHKAVDMHQISGMCTYLRVYYEIAFFVLAHTFTVFRHFAISNLFQYIFTLARRSRLPIAVIFFNTLTIKKLTTESKSGQPGSGIA